MSFIIVADQQNKLTDHNYFIFWDNGTPYLEFKPTNIITYKGINVMEMRSDVKNTHLLAYIQAFYRELEPDHLIRNIKTLGVASIKNLMRGRALVEVPINDVVKSLDYKAVPCNYRAIRETAGFYKPNACRLLAYKVLYETEQVPDRIMPVDIFELNLFFKEHFEGTPIEVFRRFCIHHCLDEKETLDTYRKKIKWEIILNNTSNHQNKAKNKKHTEVDGLIGAFFQMLK